mgnify:CR=1 FL=1
MDLKSEKILIAGAGISLCKLALLKEGAAGLSWSQIDLLSVGLFAAAFIALRKFKLNPIWVMATIGAFNVVIHIWG